MNIILRNAKEITEHLPEFYLEAEAGSQLAFLQNCVHQMAVDEIEHLYKQLLHYGVV